jgi:hypothetical protein
MSRFATIPEESTKRPRSTRTRLTIMLVIVFCFWTQGSEAQASPATPVPKLPREIHAKYLLGGQAIGSYRERAEVAAGVTRTDIDSDLIFNRLGTKLEMKSGSQYEETSEGHLKTATGNLSSSQQETHIEASVGPSTLQIKTTTGGKTYDRNVPLTGTLLGPEGTRHLVLSHCQAPGDTVSYDTFFAELGTVVTVTDRFVGSEDVITDQGNIPALKVDQTMSGMPGKIVLWLDRDGWLLRQIMPGPLGDIEAIRSSALSTDQIRGTEIPEETFTQSTIKANVRLPEERFVDSIRLRIIHRKPELGWPNLETENQHVLEKTANYVILEVTRLQPNKAATLPVASDASLAPYLSPNALFQSDDTNVQAIARRVIGNERDPWKAARALQRWTNENMEFDLGIALAPASEVAHNRRGTCFGYSMLLGALTRAVGIPSRLRMGYVYAGGIWGGHAWIDVRIGDEWIPLDGALYTPGAADAARFSLFTSALEEGTLAGMGGLGQLFSHIDIKILQYTVGGKRIVVPNNADAFTISNDMYRNSWLGFSVVKPPSFQFTESDLAWPQTTVIGMQGPDGQKVEISDLSSSLPTADFNVQKRLQSEGIDGAQSTIRIAGRRAIGLSCAHKAGAILIDHGNVWMFTATGADAKKLLERVSASVVLAR